MAAMNEPAEAAFRVNTLRAEPPGVAADLRAAGVEVTGPGSGEPARPGGRRSSSDRRASRSAPGSRTGELVPQSRGSQAVVALLDPRPGRARARPLRRARDQDHRDRGPDGGPRRDRLDRGRPAPGRGDRGALRPRRGRLRPGGGRRRDRGRPRRWLRSDPLGPALLRPRHARLAARRALAQVGRRPRAARRAPAPHAGPRGAGAGARRDARLLDLHDLRARERGRRGGARRVRRRDRGRRPRGRAPAARLAPRPALPAAAAGARPDDRVLLRPVQAAGG